MKKTEAIKLVLEWYEIAPIEEMEKVEEAIQMNFPYKALKESLEED